MHNLLFIPQPANIENTGFSHQLSRRTIIVLPEQADDDDYFAARHLKAGIREYLKFNVDVNRRFADDLPTPHILLLRADRDVKWLQAYDVPELVNEGYFISVSSDRVLLVGADATGLYYAVQTLRQVIDQQGIVLSGLTITDHPTLPVRGVMLDVSRGKVPTLKDLLGTVELLASWK
ncbi:MAG: glycoside hydrolase family 20 zincin-like fold domain-containing protein, partial [bacterium]